MIFFAVLIKPHRQRDSFLGQIDIEHLDIYNIANTHCLERVLDEFVGNLGDVHQSVLMDANIHKHAKINDISNCALQDHIGLEILHLKDITSQDGLWHVFARVPCGLLELL